MLLVPVIKFNNGVFLRFITISTLSYHNKCNGESPSFVSVS